MARLTTLKPRLAVNGQRLQTVSSDLWRQGRTSTQRGYGYRWQQARQKYLPAGDLMTSERRWWRRPPQMLS